MGCEAARLQLGHKSRVKISRVRLLQSRARRPLPGQARRSRVFPQGTRSPLPIAVPLKKSQTTGSENEETLFSPGGNRHDRRRVQTRRSPAPTTKLSRCGRHRIDDPGSRRTGSSSEARCFARLSTSARSAPPDAPGSPPTQTTSTEATTTHARTYAPRASRATTKNLPQKA